MVDNEMGEVGGAKLAEALKLNNSLTDLSLAREKLIPHLTEITCYDI